MNINDLTIGQARELAAMFGNKSTESINLRRVEMKKVFLAAVVFMSFQANANAQEQSFTQFQINQLQEQVKELQEIVKRSGRTENWTATGILATKIKGQPVHVQAIQWDGFDDAKTCWDMVKKYSHTDDFIGEGGTDDQVPTVQWNFDGDCTQTRK